MSLMALLIVVSTGVMLVGILVLLKPIMQAFRDARIYHWLTTNTEDKPGKQFKTTDEIGHALGIPEEKAREICASSTRIYKCPDKEDSWGVFGDTAGSV